MIHILGLVLTLAGTADGCGHGGLAAWRAFDCSDVPAPVLIPPWPSAGDERVGRPDLLRRIGCYRDT